MLRFSMSRTARNPANSLESYHIVIQCIPKIIQNTVSTSCSRLEPIFISNFTGWVCFATDQDDKDSSGETVQFITPCKCKGTLKNVSCQGDPCFLSAFKLFHRFRCTKTVFKDGLTKNKKGMLTNGCFASSVKPST